MQRRTLTALAALGFATLFIAAPSAAEGGGQEKITICHLPPGGVVFAGSDVDLAASKIISIRVGYPAVNGHLEEHQSHQYDFILGADGDCSAPRDDPGDPRPGDSIPG